MCSIHKKRIQMKNKKASLGKHIQTATRRGGEKPTGVACVREAERPARLEAWRMMETDPKSTRVRSFGGIFSKCSLYLYTDEET